MFNSLIFNNNDSSYGADLVTQEYLTRQHYTNKNYVDAADTTINNVLTGYATNFATNNLTSTGTTLNVGCTSATSVLNLGCTASSIQTINVGLSNGVTQINVGGPLDTVTIAGSLITNNSTVWNVADKVFTMNKGGAAASLGLGGLLFEENGIITAYIQIGASRDRYLFKIPSSGTVITLNQSLGSTDDVNFNNLALNSMSVSGNSIFGNATVNGDLNVVGNYKHNGVKTLGFTPYITTVGENSGTASMGNYQVLVGSNAGRVLTSASYANSGIGSNSLYNATDAMFCTGIGANSLFGTTTSTACVGIGYTAGSDNITGNNNTFLGTATQPASTALNNATAIGYGAVVSASDSMQLGNNSLVLVKTAAAVQCGAVTAPSLTTSGNTSVGSLTVNSYPQPIFTSGTIVSGTIKQISTQFQFGSCTYCEIKVRYQVTSSGASVTLGGLDSNGSAVTPADMVESTYKYGNAATMSYTNGAYMSVNSEVTNFWIITTIKLSRHTLSGEGRNYYDASTVYAWPGLGTARTESIGTLRCNTPNSYYLASISLTPSAGNINGNYWVTSYY